jgi:peptide/nickel transport system ATP-binding protein
MNTLRFDIRIATDERTLVDIREFQLPLDRITFLFGESGIGKSLIARAVYGLLDPEEFNITINGEPYKSYVRKPETQGVKENSFYVFQEPSSHLNPLMPLEMQIREGSLSQVSDDREILDRLLEGSDANEVRKLLEVYPKPYRPSGGEKQRIFLVMALKKIDLMLAAGRVNKQHVFVFDEPTGSLDNHFRNVFLSLLFKRFQQQRFTTLLITHDYSMVSEVTRTYRGFVDYVSFKELSLHNGRHTLSDFQPETYIGWLEKQRKEPASRKPGGESRPLLRVESGVEVFRQQLTISKDPEGAQLSALEIYPGTVVYAKAPSGTGKTTLVKLMMGLIRGKNLKVTLDGNILTEYTPRRFWQKKIWGKKMTMVFQHADEALNPRATVMETFQGLPSEKRITRESVRQSLGELFDFEIGDEFMNKQVSTLSGGQKQRLNLLRSLFLNTDILILDEPLNGLDFESTTKVLSMIRGKQRAGKGILLISHNEEIFDALISKEHIYYLQAAPAK